MTLSAFSGALVMNFSLVSGMTALSGGLSMLEGICFLFHRESTDFQDMENFSEPLKHFYEDIQDF